MRGQLRFRVEGIDVRRTAIHEKMDDALGFRGEMRGAHRKGMQTRRGEGTAAKRFVDHAAERERAHPHPAARQEIATRQETVFKAGRMMGHWQVESIPE